jgi:beta-phosphoglucomutase
MKIPPHIKAIIFDYDGVLGDSTPFNTYACKESAKKCGINLEDAVYLRCAPGGATIHDIATCIVTHYGMPEKVSEFITYKKQYDTDYVKEVQILPNARLCVALLSKHYPLAVNTGTRHILVDSFLDKYDLTKYIFTTIAAEDISLGKPDPESYLLACERLAQNPENCLVVEDGISGVVAAKKAGCYTVGITNEISKQKLYELGCDQVITDLSELMAPI